VTGEPIMADPKHVNCHNHNWLTMQIAGPGGYNTIATTTGTHDYLLQLLNNVPPSQCLCLQNTAASLESYSLRHIPPHRSSTLTSARPLKAVLSGTSLTSITSVQLVSLCSFTCIANTLRWMLETYLYTYLIVATSSNSISRNIF
jgi:hypothetical protein